MDNRVRFMVLFLLNIFCRAFHGGGKVFDGVKIGGAMTAVVLDQDKVQCRAQHGVRDRGVVIYNVDSAGTLQLSDVISVK